MIPRPYQNECRMAVVNTLRTCDSCLVDMATGLGKTVIFSNLIKEWQGRVLVVIHRKELLDQAKAEISEWTGEMAGLEMGEHTADESDMMKARVIIGSVQTLSGDRIRKFNPSEFTLVIIDEAHHAPASTYRKVIGYFR